MVHSFRIWTTERIQPARWAWVRIHPDQPHMHAAAYRMAPHHGAEFHRLAAATFQPTPVYERYVDGEWETRVRPCVGTLRLVSGNVTAEIVAHELVHAACAVYRANVREHIRLGDACGDREEQFAYIYGELFADFQDQWEAFNG